MSRVQLWMRAESRPAERRAPLDPAAVAQLVSAGFTVTVEDSPARAIPTADYAAAGAQIAAAHSWPAAPRAAIVLGLKELPADGTPLIHDHIMFGHAYKGQADGPALLARFRAGGGRLLDLEYLTDATGRRLAAFGYWAGFAGAAVGLMALAAQRQGGRLGPIDVVETRDSLIARIKAAGVSGARLIVIGAGGRVGRGACDLGAAVGCAVTRWDMAETAGGGPFPEIAAHELFVNAVYAGPGTPVFTPPAMLNAPRTLRVIADVSCDPTSPFNPVPLYAQATSFADPVIRVAEDQPLDIMAIDNLPSLLPREASEDFSAQLLPALLRLPDGEEWQRCAALFAQHAGRPAG